MYKEAAIATNTLTFDATPYKVVRTVSPKRAARLRISWFILGAIFGIFCAVSVNLFLASPIEENDAPAAAAERKISAARKKAEHNNAEALADNVALEEAGMETPTHFMLSVNKGDTLSDMLTRKGVDYQEAHAIVSALRKKYNPRRLTVGQEVELQLNEDKNAGFDVASLRIRLTPLETLELTQSKKEAFSIHTHQAELHQEMSSGGGKIKSSLYQTGIDTGVPPAILGTLINAYSYDVDFQREIRSGDKFNVVFEAMKTENDEVAGYGKMLYATITTGGEEKKIYHFARRNGEEGYYTAAGESIRKALLRTPINGARLSSGFGMRRHPILGYGKMHKGIDFAAASGTPVYAAGDGSIEYSGRKGSYGNYVRIKHNSTYSTAYAHLSGIAKSARRSMRVKQGEIIGYVGSTGASTGPHLHYELLMAGRQINPKNVKFETGNKLEGRELASFRASIKQMDLIASRLIDNQPALARAD